MEKKVTKAFFPPYFAKRKAKMNPALIKQLEEAAASEPVVTDEYGEYRLGTFLHRACVVRLEHNDGLWYCQIYSEQPVTLMIVKEIRQKFIPDACIMAMVFPGRGLDTLQNSVQLCEIPGDAIVDGELIDGDQTEEAGE